ncbi:low molecular weight protein-tyrosine-phosphatase [Streptosporangium sp. NPDC004631]
MHVSFICTGNICRSPMAAIVAKQYLHKAGLSDRVTVSSAGIEDWNAGNPADERSITVLARNGYPTEHSASHVNDIHLTADLLVPMDEGHKSTLLGLADPLRVRLLREFDPASSQDLNIPDPYFGDLEGFDEALRMIETAMPGLIAWIQLELEP